MNKKMGKTGNNVRQADFVAATFDDDRIRLPPDLSDLAQLKGADPISCQCLPRKFSTVHSNANPTRT